MTTFNLDVPKNVDAPMSFVFEDASTTDATSYRALLFVNGWQYGKVRVGTLNRTSFSADVSIYARELPIWDHKPSSPSHQES